MNKSQRLKIIRKSLGVSRHEFVKRVEPFLNGTGVALSVKEIARIETSGEFITEHRATIILEAVLAAFSTEVQQRIQKNKNKILLIVIVSACIVGALTIIIFAVPSAFTFFLTSASFLGSIASIVSLHRQWSESETR